MGNNLKIECVGTFPGGIYDQVDIDGVATIQGDLSAEEIEIDGISNIYGTVHCRKLDCDGTCTVHGPVGAESLDLDGLMTIKGDVHANTITCDGAATIHGNLRCDHLRTSGTVTVNGTKIEGRHLEGDGLLSAKYAQISGDTILFEGRVCADEIVGEKIVIHSKNISLFGFGLGSSARLIEATTIDLRGVTAQTVNGHNVHLRKGCRVEAVDCTGTLTIDASCTVGTISGQP